MLQARHGRTRSTQHSQDGSPITSTSRLKPIPDTVSSVEWSRTTSYACTRLIPSLQQIYSRGERFNGCSSDGYGLLLSNDSAFIFPYITTSTTPPILTFPLPQGEDKLLGALIPGPTNEPGLLVIMPTSGKIGFWPALHSALASSSGIETKVSLSSGEYVNHLCNAGAAGSILSTSSGRLIHISLRDATGKAVVTLTNMYPGGGWLGAIKNVATRREIVSISAGAAQSREERQIHAITKRGGLTIWEVARAGNYRNLLDIDLWSLISAQGVTEVLDVVAYPIEANSVFILTRTTKGTTKLLGIQFDSQAQPRISQSFELPSLRDPRVYLPNPGEVAFVQTKHSVHLITISDGNIQEIELKADVTIDAVGVEDKFKNKRNPALIVLTNGAGAIRIEAFPTPKARPLPVKARLEQAIFYGRLSDNPISFEPAPKKADDAAIELSSEILSGSSPFLHKAASLGDALHYRVTAMDTLTQYILKNVDAPTLLTLRENVERMVACEALWTSVNARVEDSTIMKNLIPAPFSNTNQSDAIRAFLTYGSRQINTIVTAAHQACVEAAAVLDSGPLSTIVAETNEVILSILLSVTKYRDEHPEYGSIGEKWTSTNEILQSVTVQFDITQRLTANLQESEGDELREQLVGLATICCRLYDDRIEESRRGTLDEHTLEIYHRLRPQWLRSLVSCGRAERALEIGEKFTDFQSLIEICHEQGEKANDEDIINTVLRRLEWYMHTFGYDFAKVLWNYYITHRQFWNLLHEFPNYREFLTKFFSDGKHPSISWMNEIILGDYTKAGETLLRVDESLIEKRKIQLSIAKLSYLVDHDQVPEQLIQQARVIRCMSDLTEELRSLTSDALDDTAAVEIACAALSPDNKLRDQITTLLNGESLSRADAIEYVTTKVTPDFPAALEILHASDASEELDRLIWSRCYASDDWSFTEIDQSDDLMNQHIQRTNTYAAIQFAKSNHFNIIPPEAGSASQFIEGLIRNP